MDFARKYWLDGRGRAHKATTGGGVRPGPGWTRILARSQAKSAGVEYGTPVADPRCHAHDPHRGKAPDAIAGGSSRSLSDRETDTEPPGDPQRLERSTEDPQPEKPPLHAVPPIEPEPTPEPEPTGEPSGDDYQAPDQILGPDEVDDEPPTGANPEAEAGEGCPRCDSGRVPCAKCGKLYYPCSRQEAEETAELVVSGIAKGRIHAEIIRARIDAGTPPTKAVMDLPIVHVPLSRAQRRVAGRKLRPLIARFGGLGGWFGQIVSAGVHLGGIANAAAAHPADTPTPGCAECAGHAAEAAE